jgi:hypothetical protein
MLSGSEQAEVRAALEAFAEEDGSPLVKAPYGIRFSDVPRAIDLAAGKVEMAVVSIQEEKDMYFIQLLTLSSQPATVVVKKTNDPQVLQATYEVGVFPDAEAAKRLQDAFERALLAWGAVPRFSE